MSVDMSSLDEVMTRVGLTDWVAGGDGVALAVPEVDVLNGVVVNSFGTLDVSVMVGVFVMVSDGVVVVSAGEMGSAIVAVKLVAFSVFTNSITRDGSSIGTTRLKIDNPNNAIGRAKRNVSLYAKLFMTDP